MKTQVIVGSYGHFKVCDHCGEIRSEGYPDRLCPECGQQALRRRQGRRRTIITTRLFRPSERKVVFEPAPPEVNEPHLQRAVSPPSEHVRYLPASIRAHSAAIRVKAYSTPVTDYRYISWLELLIQATHQRNGYIGMAGEMADLFPQIPRIPRSNPDA